MQCIKSNNILMTKQVLTLTTKLCSNPVCRLSDSGTWMNLASPKAPKLSLWSMGGSLACTGSVEGSECVWELGLYWMTSAASEYSYGEPEGKTFVSHQELLKVFFFFFKDRLMLQFWKLAGSVIKSKSSVGGRRPVVFVPEHMAIAISWAVWM